MNRFSHSSAESLRAEIPLREVLKPFDALISVVPIEIDTVVVEDTPRVTTALKCHFLIDVERKLRTF